MIAAARAAALLSILGLCLSLVACNDPGWSSCLSLADGRCVEETFHNPPLLEPNEDGVARCVPAERTASAGEHP